jgi:hypothetical protein
VQDYRIWWGLFVLFAVLSLLVVQRGFRRWRAARELVERLGPTHRATHAGRLRREGWRLAAMTVSLVALTLLAFAAVAGAPAPAILALKLVAVVAVASVVGLSLLR